MAKSKSVFANLQGFPTEMGAGEIYTDMSPEGKGVDLPASESDREFKKKWETEAMSISTDGFTIFTSMNGAVRLEEKGGNGGVKGQRTPTTYFKFTIGQTPTYSFYFGPDAPFYNLLGDNIKVESIYIDQKKNEMKINFNEKKAHIIIKNRKWTMPDFADDAATNGFLKQDGLSGYDDMLVSVAPYNAKTLQSYKVAMSDLSKVSQAVKDMNSEGEGIYCWNAESAEAYLSAQSFTFNSDLDKEILLPPAFDYDAADKLDISARYIRFNCVIENASLRTNNYTGLDAEDPSILMTTLQFPGDEALLAPMGTSDEGTEVACGLEAPEGRVLKTISPIIVGDAVQQVKLEFHDGSFCIFPDAETGLFTATDKETGQELQGRVENLIVAEGKWKENHTTEVANRLERNTNRALSLESEGKPATSAIAWRTTNPSTLKIIVPTDEGTKLITIPLREA